MIIDVPKDCEGCTNNCSLCPCETCTNDCEGCPVDVSGEWESDDMVGES